MVNEARVLEHLAVIMDGNRRWAKRNGKSIKEGHKAGAETLTNLVKWCIDFDIKYLTVYAFSSENWKREKSEINDIMSLLRKYLSEKQNEFDNQGVMVRAIGRKDRVDADILKKVEEIEAKTKNNSKLVLNIAFDYGGRAEIVDAVKKIVKDIEAGNIAPEDLDEKLFGNYLYYGNTPDPDLVIRTSGEYRISNFLLWEIAYSEFYFSNTLWPDFSKDELKDIINNFKTRERRYGGTK